MQRHRRNHSDEKEEFWVDLPTILERHSPSERAAGQALGPRDTPLQREAPAVPGEATRQEPYGPSFTGQAPAEPPAGQRGPAGTALTSPASATDPDGSWTGLPEDPLDTPVQDADDL